MNTWPNGYRHALDPNEHEAWNARHYPGTRQLCSMCDEPTGRCEEDSMWSDDGEPVCEECYGETVCEECYGETVCEECYGETVCEE